MPSLVKTDVLGTVNDKIGSIIEEIDTTQTAINTALEGIKSKIDSTEVGPKLAAYKDVTKQVCDNMNQALKRLREFLEGQIIVYEAINAETADDVTTTGKTWEDLMRGE